MTGSTTDADLREEIVRLGPWHHEIAVTPELSTRVFLETRTEGDASDPSIAFIDRREEFHRLLAGIYPDGLAGRSVLDCACNCGAYLFWTKEAGAGECFGFDVREHWIAQAEFLRRHRTERSDGMRFEVRDLYELPGLGLAPFDVTLFNGIFYHLPDPVTGLRVAADLTRELIVVNTATRNGLPDGLLAVSHEDTERLMSGVYGLNWLPTGPEVMRSILRWLGFPAVRCVFWKTDAPHQPPHLGRMLLVAAREHGLFARFKSAPGLQDA